MTHGGQASWGEAYISWSTIHEGGADGADTYVQAGAVISSTLYWKMWPEDIDKGWHSL